MKETARSRQRLPAAEPDTNQTIVWAPSVMADDSSYEQAVLHMIAAGRPTNTSKQYDGKVEEYSNYCDSVYPLDAYRQNLCASKLYRFIFYQAMHNKKKRGGKGGTASLSRFDRSEYNTVMGKYCLVYTSDAPDERHCVGSGGRLRRTKPTNNHII